MTKPIDKLIDYTAEQRVGTENSEVTTQVAEASIDGHELVIDTLKSGEERFHLQDVAECGLERLLEDEFGEYESTVYLDTIQSGIEEKYDGDWELEWLNFGDGSGGLGVELGGEKVRVDTLVDTSGVQLSHIAEQSEYDTGDIYDIIRENELYADSLRSPDVSTKYVEKYSKSLERYQNMDVSDLTEEVGEFLYPILGFVPLLILLVSVYIALWNSSVLLTSAVWLLYPLIRPYGNFYKKYIAPRLAVVLNKDERVARKTLYSVPEQDSV